MKVSQLQTPEVNLYYTVRGSGPMLLILQGGAGNADGSEALANELSADFTIVTYDRRGLSRSTLIQPDRYEIASHADDAARLIGALSGEPAFVFGSSLVLLCYKQTFSCRIVSWAKKLGQAHSRNALRHISRAWQKPQDMPIAVFR
jgi:hypothetical protein